MKASAQPLASQNKSGTAQKETVIPITSWWYQKPACSWGGDKAALATDLPAGAEPSNPYPAAHHLTKV